MDPRKIVSRNENWWNSSKSTRHEYELVGASEVLERSRFVDERTAKQYMAWRSVLIRVTWQDVKRQYSHQRQHQLKSSRIVHEAHWRSYAITHVCRGRSKVSGSTHCRASWRRFVTSWRSCLNAKKINVHGEICADHHRRCHRKTHCRLKTCRHLQSTSNLELPSFNESWKKFPNTRFGLIKEFLGTVATVHATTAEIEGDFSRHKFSRTGRDQLRSFGIQSEIHAKQWGEISECVVYYKL